MNPSRIRMAALRVARRIQHRRSPLRYTDADPFKILFTAPSDVAFVQVHAPDVPGIAYDARGRFDPLRNAGFVVDGRWDECRYALRDWPRYQLLRQRFVDGAAWEDTLVIRDALAAVRRGERRWGGCRSEAEVRDRCRRIDALFESMRARGYRRAQELDGRPWRTSLDELTLNIGRTGELLRAAFGGNRLCIALILGIEAIPARVLLRHANWQAVRNVRRMRRGTRGDQPDHPDLRDLA